MSVKDTASLRQETRQLCGRDDIGDPHASDEKDFRPERVAMSGLISKKDEMVIWSSAVDHVMIFVMLSDGEAYIVLLSVLMLTVK